MSCKGWAWLRRHDGLLKNFAHERPTVASVPDRDLKLPWFIALLVGSHSRKHVLISNREICLRKMQRAIGNFSSRVRWARHFRESDGADDGVRLLKWDPRAYRGVVSLDFDAFCRAARRVTLDYVKVANSRTRRSKCTSNTPMFVKSAWAWLKRESMAATPSDKDKGGVLAIAHRDKLEAIVNEKLRNSNSCYRAVNDHIPTMRHTLTRPAVHAACKSLKKLGYEKWTRECGWACEEYGQSKMVSKSDVHVKNT